MQKFSFLRGALICLFVLSSFYGCGTSYSVNGSIINLQGVITLTNNITDAITIEATGDATFAFPTKLVTGKSYLVEISSQPDQQVCMAEQNSGIVESANVTNIRIVCANKDVVLGGRIIGLDGVLVVSDGGESLGILNNGLFHFSELHAVGENYLVEIIQQPDGQTCTVLNAEGTIGSVDQPDLLISCTEEGSTPFVVGGISSGPAQGVVLTNNGVDVITIEGASDQYFQFAGRISNEADYSVQIVSEPVGVVCKTTDNRGKIQGENIYNIRLDCKLSANGIPQFYSAIPRQIWGGADVKISGVNLTQTTVTINGIVIETSLQLDDEIRFVAPELKAGVHELVLENSAGRDVAYLDYGSYFQASKIAPGQFHACALTPEGTVYCWGENKVGQLGVGDGTPRSMPTLITGIDPAVEIGTGSVHTCLLSNQRTVQCWGGNQNNQLGNGSYVNHVNSPAPVPGIESASEIAVGGYHSCVLLEGGQVKCWGRNVEGQLGNGSSLQSTLPTDVADLTTPLQIAAGNNHSCALLTDRTVKCWGNNDSGELGNGTNVDSSIPVMVVGVANAKMITAGGEHTCAALLDGSVQCWGRNKEGQLGNGSLLSSNVPVTVAALSAHVTSLVTGTNHTCALTENSEVYCWGANARSMTGDNNIGRMLTPTLIAGLSNVTGIDAGFEVTCVRLQIDLVQCLGRPFAIYEASEPELATALPAATELPPVKQMSARFGQLCLFDTDNQVSCLGQRNFGAIDEFSMFSNVPVEVAGLNDPVAVSAGADHACALQQSGNIQCWGYNYYGQLGNGSSQNRNEPAVVSGIQNASEIGKGTTHNCALTNDGEVYCWGYNRYGELGNGSTASSSLPVRVSGLQNAIDIAIGSYHSCTLLDIGQVACWGRNSAGEIGLAAARIQSDVPVVLAMPRNVQKVTAGAGFSCALTGQGDVYCWGTNSEGQLGTGNYINQYQPSLVLGLSDVTDIESGDSHTCAITTAEVIRCWGNNSQGQLGDGSFQNSNTPLTVAHLRRIEEMALGRVFSCARTETGNVYCWGKNDIGQISYNWSRYMAQPPIRLP